MHSLDPFSSTPQRFNTDDEEPEMLRLSLPPLIHDHAMLMLNESSAERSGSSQSQFSFRGTPDPLLTGAVDESIQLFNPVQFIESKSFSSADLSPVPQSKSSESLKSSIARLEALDRQEKDKQPSEGSEKIEKTVPIPKQEPRKKINLRIEAMVKAQVERELEQEKSEEDKSIVDDKPSRRHTGPIPKKKQVSKRRLNELNLDVPLRRALLEADLKDSHLEWYGPGEKQIVLEIVQEEKEKRLKHCSEVMQQQKLTVQVMHSTRLKREKDVENPDVDEGDIQPIMFQSAGVCNPNPTEISDVDVRFFQDPLFAQVFYPKTVFHYVQLAKKSQFSFPHKKDIPLIQFCDVHSLPQREPDQKPCWECKKCLVNEMEKGMLNPCLLKAILKDNLNAFFFIDEDVRLGLKMLIDFAVDKNFLVELFLFLEKMTAADRLNQALFLISFLCYFHPLSNFLAVQYSDYLMRKGFYQEAMESLNAILAISPHEIYGRVILAECLFSLGDTQAALVHISEARARHPLCLYTTTLMSGIITSLQGRLDPSLSSIIEQNPHYPYPLTLRAEFYFQNKHYYEASMDYKRLLQINPKFVYAYHRYHLTLGILHANNGRV